MQRHTQTCSIKKSHGPLGSGFLFLFALALIIALPSEAQADDKFRNTWTQKLAEMTQRLKQKVRSNARRKFSMPIRGNQRKPLNTKKNTKKVNKKNAREAKQQAAKDAAQAATRATQMRLVAELRENIKAEYARARRLEKRARREYRKDRDLKKFKRYMVRKEVIVTNAVQMKGNLYTILGQLKREDELREERIAQSRRNFRRHRNRSNKDSNRHENTRANRKVLVAQTKLKVLTSKIEVLNAQANVARLEGDLVNSRQMKTEATALLDQISKLKRELVDAKAQLATVNRTKPAQSPGQQVLNKFRKHHITPDYLAGKITGAVQLLKKYEGFGAPALAGDAI